MATNEKPQEMRELTLDNDLTDIYTSQQESEQ